MESPTRAIPIHTAVAVHAFRNMRHIVRVHVSVDGKTWKRFEHTFEVSGYHHNVRGRFLSLKPGLFAAGEGEARFRDFRYRVPSGP
jgi:xylan 1,4-beta-xylosidase